MDAKRSLIASIVHSLCALSGEFLLIQSHKESLLNAINRKDYAEIALHARQLKLKLPENFHILKRLEAALGMVIQHGERVLALAQRYKKIYPKRRYAELESLLESLIKARGDIGRKSIFKKDSIHSINQKLLSSLESNNFKKAKSVIEEETAALEEVDHDILGIFPIAERMASAGPKEKGMIRNMLSHSSLLGRVAATILLTFSALYLSATPASASTAELDNKLLEWDQEHISFVNTENPKPEEIAAYKKKTFGLLDSLLECLAFEEFNKVGEKAKETRSHISHILKVTRIPENIVWQRLEVKKKALEKKMEDERISREKEEKDIAAMQKESEKKQQEVAKKEAVREFILDLSIDGKPVRISFTPRQSRITGDAPESKKGRIVEAINQVKGIDAKQKEKAIALLQSQWDMEKEF